MDLDWIESLTSSPWLVPALFALVVGDAFLVVLPGEVAVTALGSLWGSTGSPAISTIIAVAAAGAMTGDVLCFLIGRRVGLDRWAWQRRPRVAAAIDRVRDVIGQRAATLILTARYVPFARIAVNLTAGASGMRWRRFLPITAIAGVGWACWNSLVGAAAGALLVEQPVLGVVVSVVIAIAVGLVVDAIGAAVARRRSA